MFMFIFHGNKQSRTKTTEIPLYNNYSETRNLIGQYAFSQHPALNHATLHDKFGIPLVVSNFTHASSNYRLIGPNVFLKCWVNISAYYMVFIQSIFKYDVTYTYLCKSITNEIMEMLIKHI